MPAWGCIQPAAGWTFHAGATNRGLCRLELATTDGCFLAGLAGAFPEIAWCRDDADPLIRETSRQLTEYFEGQRAAFHVPLDLRGTEFRQKVWRELRRIPYGETRSYGELARTVGNPGASRAVGSANGGNPVIIIVPCHRVIAAGGGLGGFGPGLGYKRKLLEIEGAWRKPGAA